MSAVLTVTPTVVHVPASGGVNWAAIATAIVTGVVGVAGIIGTFWNGKRAREAASKDLLASINAENQRAKRAERRQVYARHLAACTDAMLARHFSSPGQEGGTIQEGSTITYAYANASLKAMDTASEVELIAPGEIGDLAIRLVRLIDEADKKLTDYLSVRDQLLRAMRVDLGEEPGGPVTAG